MAPLTRKSVKSKRAVVGFLVSPAAPGALLYVYGLTQGYGTAAFIAPLLLMSFGYFAALVIGIPTYFCLDRKGVRGLPAYVFGGALIGAGFDSLLNLPNMYSMHYFPFGEVLMATVYAAISAAVFWSIAVRGGRAYPCLD